MPVYNTDNTRVKPWQRILVYLDNKLVPHVYFADTDEGIIRHFGERVTRDASGLDVLRYEERGQVRVEIVSLLKAFRCEDDIFAATDRAQAFQLAVDFCGGDPDDLPFDEEDFYELADAELDAEQPEFDENENETGETTTIRSWLATAEPGWLAGPNN